MTFQLIYIIIKSWTLVHISTLQILEFKMSQKTKAKECTENTIKIAISGIGNCASALLQGLAYYRKIKPGFVPGLMHPTICGYHIFDIKLVAAFDVDKRKVGKDASLAIFAKPNNTTRFCKKMPKTGVIVQMGPVLDGVSELMKTYPDDRTFLPSEQESVDVVRVLKKTGAQILINYMPVGSKEATAFYAQSALDANVAFINAMPEFICSDKTWAKKFENAGIPCLGDDVKSQLGATIIHRALAHLFSQRGISCENSYQLNVGGNTDFANMKAAERLKSKQVSKTESVESQLLKRLSYDNLHVGPADYIPFLGDNKEAFIHMLGTGFGENQIKIFTRLEVTDSPNSAGVIIDAIRLVRVALDRKMKGPLLECSAFLMKHPLIQMTDDEAYEGVEKFIRGDHKWITVFPSRTSDLSQSGEFYSEIFSEICKKLEYLAKKNDATFWNNSVSEKYCNEDEYLLKLKEVVLSEENKKENTLFVSFCYINKMKQMEKILKEFSGNIVAVNSPSPENIKLPILTYLGPDDTKIGELLAIEALKHKKASSKIYILEHKENYYPFALREKGIKSLIPQAIIVSLFEGIPGINKEDIVISFGNRSTEALIDANIKATIIAIDENKKVKKETNVTCLDQGVSEYVNKIGRMQIATS